MTREVREDDAPVVGGPWVVVPRRPGDDRPVGDVPQLAVGDVSVGTVPVGDVPVGDRHTDAAAIPGDSPAGGPVPAGPVRPARWTRRSAIAAGAALVCVVAAAIGAAAGWARAEATHRQQLVADTRLLLWTGSSTDSGGATTGGGTTTGGGAAGSTATRLAVTVLDTGAPVTLQQVVLGAGSGTVADPVTLTPGAQTSVELVLHPDCTLVTEGGDPLAITGEHAQVRLAGSATSRSVPVQVLDDPTALMLSLLAPCSAAAASTEGVGSVSTAGSSSGEQTAGRLAVSALRATTAGRLLFTLTATEQAARFSLPVAVPSDPTVRYSLTSTPALPITVRPGRPVRVSEVVRAICSGRATTMPTTYGVLLPAAAPAGTTALPSDASSSGSDAPSDSVSLDGWDDGIAASALSAAVIHDC